MPTTKSTATTMEAVLIAIVKELATVTPRVPDEYEDPKEELLSELHRAHKKALLCDWDDACDADSDIREAIKLIEAELPCEVPAKITQVRFMREPNYKDFTQGMDYGDRLSSVNDLIMTLEECQCYATDAGYDSTDISGYIDSALDIALESQTYLEQAMTCDNLEELRYATSVYFRAAI